MQTFLDIVPTDNLEALNPHSGVDVGVSRLRRGRVCDRLDNRSPQSGLLVSPQSSSCIALAAGTLGYSSQ